jgi:hypothetical protein
MFDSSQGVIRQFLTGSTEGPIGMSEEKDAGEGGASSGDGERKKRKAKPARRTRKS